MNNGEKCDRKWLMFSESTGCVFCYVCKLFSTDYDNVFVKSGFYNWKKAKQTIFDGIHAALCHIAEDTEEKSDTRHEALCLLNKITKLEFAFMAVLWHHILKRFNAVSKFLQKIELDLHTASSMLLSLINFVKNLRNDFTRFENESKKLS